MTKTLTDLAYDIAKTNFNDKKHKETGFTFDEIWTALVKKARLSKEEQQQVGSVYTSMLQDHRFIFIGDKHWKVREQLTEAEQTNLSHALYDFKQEEEAEKQRIAGLNDKEMLDQEAYYDEEDLEQMFEENKEKLKHDDMEDDEDIAEANQEQDSDEEEDEEDAE